MDKPLILVTNDDGIAAPGMRALIDVAKEFGEVIVVAPDKAQSGMGHAITINNTIRLNEVKIDADIKEWSCTGTPVDCVKLAVNMILHRKPDLLLSGINHGPNSSISVIYSGTMSAAVEGAIEGIPSIGFSLYDYSVNADFTLAKSVVRKMIDNVLKNGLPQGICLNVNIPMIGLNEFKGIKVCRQSKAIWDEEFDERKDPSGNKYYWMAGSLRNQDQGDDTDEHALKNHFASVVPVQFDLTAYQALQNLKTWNYEVQLQ
jgi:5'-nucleotidase